MKYYFSHSYLGTTMVLAFSTSSSLAEPKLKAFLTESRTPKRSPPPATVVERYTSAVPPRDWYEPPMPEGMFDCLVSVLGPESLLFNQFRYSLLYLHHTSPRLAQPLATASSQLCLTLLHFFRTQPLNIMYKI